MMRNWLSLGLILLVSAGTIAACGGGDEEKLPDVDCTAGPIPTFDQVTGFEKCTTCHDSGLTGASRQSAPPDINFDTYDAAKAHAKKAASEVNEGAMPPKDSSVAPLTQAEKDTLYKWALCGTPAPGTGMTDAGGGGDAAGGGDGG